MLSPPSCLSTKSAIATTALTAKSECPSCPALRLHKWTRNKFQSTSETDFLWESTFYCSSGGAYSKLGNVYAYIPFGSFNRRYMDAKDVSDASEHAKTMEGGWAYFLPLPVLQSSEESRRVSSTNSFKRSQGPWGLSFLLKPAKGSAISLLKLTGHWVSHESRQQYASSTSLNQTIELVWATSFARSGSLQTTNGFIKFWPVWADTYNALPV